MPFIRATTLARDVVKRCTKAGIFAQIRVRQGYYCRIHNIRRFKFDSISAPNEFFCNKSPFKIRWTLKSLQTIKANSHSCKPVTHIKWTFYHIFSFVHPKYFLGSGRKKEPNINKRKVPAMDVKNISFTAISYNNPFWISIFYLLCGRVPFESLNLILQLGYRPSLNQK